MKNKLTADRLRELLHYDPETGVFTRRVSRRVHAVGSKAGYINRYGYECIVIDQRLCYSHRLAWLYMTGEWPAHEIDHKDGNRANNGIENLREAERGENAQNRKAKNKTGFLGVDFHKHTKKWRARICIWGVTHELGYFATPEEAGAAYAEAKKQLHKFQPVERL